MGEYFPKLKSLEGNVKVKLDLPNYATKADLKNAINVDTSQFVKKADFATLKSDIDKLDISKLETAPVDLNKLSDIVKNQAVKKTEHDELVK